MKIIYQPRGKALEYGYMAANLYSGCSHGCTYCYAPAVLHMSRDMFISAKPRTDIITKLDRDAAFLNQYPNPLGKTIFLCFTCDPYQPIDVELKLTRQAITILHNNSMNVCLLTKGGKRSERDFDLLTREDSYGATLTFFDKNLSRDFEPYASPPEERFEALSQAHSLGIPTWVSLEPIINVNETLKVIRETISYVDEYKIGTWNYDKRASEIDYSGFLKEAIEICTSAGVKYHIKNDMVKYIGH
jgi:DNA repair photolyase